MHLLFISYEYPPDTAVGGIATYVHQIAQLLSSNGIFVDVIAASPLRAGTYQVGTHLQVTLLQCDSSESFRVLSPAAAAQIHQQHPLDLIETPEYGAEAIHIKEMLPEVPLVVKLHTPRYLIKKLNNFYYDQQWFRKIKQVLFGAYDPEKDPEYKAIQNADYILSPSASLREIVAADWAIPRDKIMVAPNPYVVNPDFFQPATPAKDPLVVYLGRLETRKGLYALARAIPLVLQEFPQAHFMFVGKDSTGPFREKSMKQVLTSLLQKQLTHLTFTDKVSLNEIPGILASASLVVLPSIWENFPNVCLEAMLAGKPIVGSKEGGMSDMLQEVGEESLADPMDPCDIANKIIYFFRNPQRAQEIGLKNQVKARHFYGHDLIFSLIDLYRKMSLRNTEN